MSALIYIVLAAALITFGYYKRHGFRRAWYILRTDAQNPDWQQLGADHFLSSRERARLMRKPSATSPGSTSSAPTSTPRS